MGQSYLQCTLLVTAIQVVTNQLTGNPQVNLKRNIKNETKSDIRKRSHDNMTTLERYERRKRTGMYPTEKCRSVKKKIMDNRGW